MSGVAQLGSPLRAAAAADGSQAGEGASDTGSAFAAMLVGAGRDQDAPTAAMSVAAINGVATTAPSVMPPSAPMAVTDDDGLAVMEVVPVTTVDQATAARVPASKTVTLDVATSKADDQASTKTLPTASSPDPAMAAALFSATNIAPVAARPADTPGGKGADPSRRAVATAPGAPVAPSSSGADASVTDTAPPPPVDPSLAPVMAALADSAAASAQSASPSPAVQVAPTVVAPTNVAAPPAPQQSTAALMASRQNTTGSLVDSHNAAESARKDDSDTDGDASTSAAPVSDALLTTILSVAPAAHTAAHDAVAASSGDSATHQLAAGSADRQLDLAKQGAWLDGIAHDIAATGDASSPLRFGVAPQHLGSVQVEILRGGDGASVTLTANSEASRAALADARPLLVADARAQGIHIASAQVDVGGNPTDSRSSSQSQAGQRSPASSTNGDANFSGQASAQGDSGRQSQTRSQLLGVNHVRSNRTVGAATDADPTTTVAPTDGLYA